MTKCICVWYWFIFLTYVSPFLKKKTWRVISIDVSTKKHVEKVKSDIVGNYPSAGYGRNVCDRMRDVHGQR